MMKTLRKSIIIILLFQLLVYSITSFAEESQEGDHEADRVALRQMLADIQDGLNQRDFSKIKPHLDDKIIITFLNAELTKGISGAEQYMNKIFEGAGAILKGYSTNATVDQPAIFYGNTAVAAGHTIDSFKFSDGLGIDLNTRWSTTVVKEGEKWKIIALHFSANIFNNPFLAQARNSNLYFGIAGLVLGLLVILVVAKLKRKKTNA